MKKWPLATLGIILFLDFLSPKAFPFEGPLQARNQFPLFLSLNAPYLETASYDNFFGADLSYSSVYMVRRSPVWSVGLDFEVAQLNFRFRRVISDLFELGLDVPFLSFNSGFMDDFLSAYHKTFGFSDYGRSERPANSFLYEVKRNGVLVMKGEGGRVGIGDIRLTVKKTLLSDDPTVSLLADIELPTGRTSNGFGNGSVDAGVALLLDKRISERIKAYLNLGAVFPGNWRAIETIRLSDYVYGGVCVEAAVSKKISLLGQIFAQNSPFPKTGIGSMDRIAVLLTLGGRYSSGKNSFELSLTEDPNTAGAPDFTVTLAYKRRF